MTTRIFYRLPRAEYLAVLLFDASRWPDPWTDESGFTWSRT